MSSSNPNAEYVAINGMLGALDPHSVLFDPDQVRQFAEAIKNRFFGIGIVLDGWGDVPFVKEVRNGGPAAEAGVAACDQIFAIDGRSAAGLSFEQLIGLLRGEAGSTITVTFLRDERMLDLLMTRREISFPSATGRLLDGEVGCIKIDRFAKGTAAEVETTIANLRKAGARAWILDLRSNSGGLLAEAIRVASVFVPTGPIVTVVSDGGKTREAREARPVATEGGPVVVLIDQSTASASEIVASALQVRNRAAVLGRTSWGKGTVQVLFNILDGSQLKLTVAHYVTPGGVSLQSRGITPDVELLPIPIPRKGRVRLSEPDLEREAGLDRAFAPGRSARSAGISLRYVVATPNAEEEIAIAHDLLLATRTSNRWETLVRGKALLDERREAEEARIVRVLGEAGIDWSPGSSSSPPRLAIRCAERAAPAEPDRVLVDCEVKNDGSGDAFRVHGRTDALAYDLKDQEIVVGRVAAGTSRSLTFEGILAEDKAARVTYVPFAFSEQGGAAVECAPLRVEAPARPRPSKGSAAGPEIRIADGVRETQADAYPLGASIVDQLEVRDAWIRISNRRAGLERKKVMYRARPEAGPRDRMDLSSDVPLSAGLNEIGVCARGKELEQCETLFVFRLPPTPN